jgi:hypothetical protein
MKLKRAVIAGLAFGLVTMALDAGVAHFAGRPLKHPAQLVPVLFGAVAIGLLVSLFEKNEARLLKIARVVAGGAIAVGLLGSAYHAMAFMRMLTAGGAVDTNMIGVALSIAPPLLAPGAFAGLGAALLALSSPRVGITLAAQRHEPVLAAA